MAPNCNCGGRAGGVSCATMWMTFLISLNYLAAAFVVLRVLHSIVQATANKVVVRFSLFALSWVAMGIMIVRAALASF